VALFTSSGLKALNLYIAISFVNLTSYGIVNQKSCKDRMPLRTIPPSTKILDIGANNNLFYNRIFDADTMTRTLANPDGEIVKISPKLFSIADQCLPSTTM